MKKARVALFIAGVLVLASAAASYLFYDEYRSVQDSVEQVRAEYAERVRELEGQLKLARAEVSDYREKLQAAEKIAEDVERELDAKARLVDEHAAKIEDLEAELETLTAPEPPEEPAVAVLGGDEAPGGDTTPLIEDVEGGGEEPAAATTAGAAEGVRSRTDLERELEEVRAEKRELEKKRAALLGDKAGGVPLGEVRVTTGLKLKGKVLVVNERYSFVVIDLGARDGVEKGMVLIVHRDRKFIGKCQVEKVYNRMAAADLVLDWMKDQVQVGDGVRKF